MKKFKHLLIALISALALLSLSSCDEKYTDLDVYIDCTQDLLEYVTPKIEVIVNGGEKVDKTLGIFDFEETEGSATHFETGTKVNLYRYTYHERNEDSKIEVTVKVSYSLKPNLTFNKDLYIFCNDIRLTITEVDNAALIYTYELGNTLGFPDKEGAEEFLKDFCSHSYERSFTINPD